METQSLAVRVNRLVRVSFVMFVLTVALAAAAHAAPTPVITTNHGTSGMAPFTLHVHGISTGISTGDRIAALFEWDFGDPNGAYNKIVGTSCAHVFDNPGTYTVRLTVTEENGVKASTTITVNVAADTRSAIYVAANGNDSNPGTQAAPIRTVSRASQLMGANKKFLFRRGDTFDMGGHLYINHANVLVGAYGSGNKPVFRWTAGTGGYPSLIQLHGASTAVVIEDLGLTTIHAPGSSVPRGVHPQGQNITVRRCSFSNLSDAFNAEGTVYGFLALQNTVDMMAGYFLWAQGSDHTILANTAAGSLNEHTVRLAGVQRAYIGFNDFTNTVKTTIWCMTGADAYISRNVLKSGHVIVGPNFTNSWNSERFTRAVADGNRLTGAQVIFYAGAEKVMFRNNVIDAGGLEAFSIWGWLAAYNRTVDDVRLLNNTAINNSNLYGKFVKIGSGTQRLTAMNNLYYAPNLNTAYAAANAQSMDSTLSTHTFDRNLWASPRTGTSVHFFNTSGIGVASWDALAQVGTENYRLFNTGDLSSTFAPQNFNANIGLRINGVHLDMNGNYRPTSGSVFTVGAYELNPSSGGNPTPPPPPPPPPPANSIVYNMQDGTGWTVASTALTDGAWERGNPAGGGLRGDPASDFDGSGACWLTGNRPGDSDVDGGPTTVTSPAVNLSQGGSIVVSYALWMYNENTNDNDDIRVEVSNNNGQTWRFVHLVKQTSGWQTFSFRLADFVTATSQVRLRFMVTDNPNNSVTEAAIDKLEFCFSGCPSPNVVPTSPSGDANGDGLVDVNDLIAVVLAWGACTCPADLTHDGLVNADDLVLVISHWS